MYSESSVEFCCCCCSCEGGGSDDSDVGEAVISSVVMGECKGSLIISVCKRVAVNRGDGKVRRIVRLVVVSIIWRESVSVV